METLTTAETASAMDASTPATPPRRRRLVRSMLLVLVGLLLGALIPLPDGPFHSSSEPPTRGIPDPTTTGSPRSVDQFSFTSSSQQGDGWRHFESAIERVALDLPPNWGPFPTESGGPNLIFDASDGYPFTGYGAVLWVVKSDIGRTPSDAARYWGMWRRHIQTTIEVVGDVTMRTMSLPAGEVYVVDYVTRVNGNDFSETMYGLVSGSTEYRLIFGVSSGSLSRYQDMFDEIVRSFTIL